MDRHDIYKERIRINLNIEDCPLCKNNSLYFSHTINSYSVIKCKKCRVQFLSPFPNPETLNPIYGSDYFLGSHDLDSITRIWALKRKTADLYLEQFQSMGGLQNGDLLEIGCGTGDFLVESQSKGYNVSGIEISHHAVAMANKKLNFNKVQQGTLEQIEFPSNSFDVIAFFDVIEHINSPTGFIAQAYKLLRPGGKIFLVTPSLDSWSARLLGIHWMEYKLEHLWYFSNKAISILLENTGFKNVHILPNPKILDLDYINMHFQRYYVPFFSPLVKVIRTIVPDSLALHPIRLIASGMAVIAEK